MNKDQIEPHVVKLPPHPSGHAGVAILVSAGPEVTRREKMAAVFQIAALVELASKRGRWEVKVKGDQIEIEPLTASDSELQSAWNAAASAAAEWEDTLVAPRVHLNGTSADELKRQYREAMRSVDRSVEAVVASAPHGRDYYPISDVAFKKAQSQHQSRLRRLADIKQELADIFRQIRLQGKGRDEDDAEG